jgi:hypothetical protein
MFSRRWWCVEMKGQGHDFGKRIFVGRVEATPQEIHNHFGPYVYLDAKNGECYIYGKPRRELT